MLITGGILYSLTVSQNQPTTVLLPTLDGSVTVRLTLVVPLPVSSGRMLRFSKLTCGTAVAGRPISSLVLPPNRSFTSLTIVWSSEVALMLRFCRAVSPSETRN